MKSIDITTEHFEPLDQDLNSEGVSDLLAPKLVEGVLCDNPECQLDAIKKICLLLAKDKNTAIERVVACNVVPRFVEFLRTGNSALQFETARALTNIASGTSSHAQAIISANGVPALIDLLALPVQDIREQAASALGTIAGNSAPSRDCLLQHGALGPLLAVLDEHDELSMIRKVAFALKNICRDTDAQYTWESISPALPALARLIYAPDDAVLADACWALAHLLDRTDDTVQDILEAGVCRRLIDLLAHPCPAVRAPALRAICNLSTGEGLQTQVAVACGVVPALAVLLVSPEHAIRMEACCAVANIAAGSYEHIRALINAHVVPMLISLLHDADAWTRNEASRALSNATSHGVLELAQIEYIVSQGCVKALCDQLQATDSEVIHFSLNGLYNILCTGEVEKEYGEDGDANPYVCYVEEAGGVHAIHELQRYDDPDICKIACLVMDTYFPDESDAA